LNAAATSEQCWQALHELAQSLVGSKLFTVMTVDMAKLLARRAFTSDAQVYPVSGTKPITLDRWFDVVHHQKKTFVANTIGEIADVFPDHEKIWALGCGSVVNLPIIVEEELVATVNLLHEEHYYTPARVELLETQLSKPSRLAYLRERQLVQQ
jgi:GAF domain